MSSLLLSKEAMQANKHELERKKWEVGIKEYGKVLSWDCRIVRVFFFLFIHPVYLLHVFLVPGIGKCWGYRHENAV